METRICRKCLLREGVQEGGEGYVKRYLENLPEEEKTQTDSYEMRLSVCKSCNMLLEAMCRACGCYVEFRAAIKKQTCPYEKWTV